MIYKKIYHIFSLKIKYKIFLSIYLLLITKNCILDCYDNTIKV